MSAPHVAPLDALAREIGAAHGRAPRFDPAGAGTAARILVLLETPGPDGGAAPDAARIVSPLNATGTARNLRRFLAEAGIGIGEIVLWNAIPFVIHAPGARNRGPRAAERAAGLRWVAPLLARLPDLRVAVLAGRTAAAARDVVERARPGLPVLLMPHPSPNAVAADPDAARRSVAALGEARRIAGGP